MAERSPRNWLTLVLLGAAAAVPWHRLPAQQESSPPGTPSAETAGDGREPETSESQYDDEFRDPVDASAPSDPKAAKRLQQAESLIAQQRWERAQEVLLFTLDRAEGAMVRRRDGRLVSVADEANRLLGTLPRDALELYRRQYGPAADKLLAEGVTSGRRELVEQVATQFRHTRAGGEAVRRLAAIHFDRGEFGLAARRYRQLAAADFDPAARIRAAYAFAATGDVQEAERLLASLTDADRAAMPAGWDADRLVAAAGRFGESRLVDDWLLPQGDATGAALVRAGEPVLLRRWSRPLTHRSEIQEQIDRTTQDLRDEGRATVPASVPLAVGDRVAARTLRGVAVYSSSDGRLLWETVDENSPERLLAAGDQSIDAETRQVIRFRFQFGADPSAGASDQKPLANLLYRDGVYGFLSSDGERLFAVEDHSPLLRPEAVFLDGPAGGAVRRSAASNRLVAYDLDTGRPAWPAFGGLGGLVEDGPFEPPLAGYTFFGPPTPADGELYVVGEKEKEIRLIALDPATGSVRWERLIAHAQAGIDQDPVRRGWPAPVATAGGVLVCPTTVGWLVGVDRSSRSILWAYRYAPPQPGREPGEANPVAAPAALNSRWGPSAPILHRGRVFFTPSEEARLVCLDLYTGELVWQRGKGANLYVAGVAGDRLVTVGVGAVEGIDVSNGVVRWSVPIPEDAGRPSGRAVLAEDRLFLPVRGDSLWQIDVRTGELVAEKPLPPGGVSLGNLVMHRGTLLSYSPEGLTAFEERTELARQVDERLKENPGDAAASLRRAELQHSDGESLAAAATLDGLDVAALPAGDAAKFRRLRWDVLSALVRSEDAAPEAADRHLSELAAFAATPEERLAVRRLQADRASAAGKTAEAARAYLDLLKDSDAAGVVPEDGGRRRVRLTAWLGGRFEDLWTAAEGDARKTLDERIGEALRSAETDRDRERLTQVFAFHPAAAEVVRKLAAADLAAGRFAEAEARLLRLVRSDHVAVPAAALLDLADAAERAGLAQDARYWIEQARRYEPETVLPDGTSLEDAITRRATGKETGHRPAAGGHWGDFRLVVVRSGGYMSTETALEIAPDGAELPFFRDRRLQLAAQQDRLMISGPGGAGLERFVALRSGVRTGRRPAVVADGHLLFVLHQGVVQAVSPVEGRVLWSAPGPDDPTGMFPGETSPTAMRPAAALAGTAGLFARSRRNGSMPAASASYVALQGRGGLSVLDAATGELRWTRDDLPRGATIVGTESVLYVVPREGSRRMALRAVDGRAVPLGQAGKWLPHAVGAVGDRLVTVVAEEPPFRLFDLPLGRRSVVSLRDPQTGDILWSRAYPSDALFDLTADGRLCILSPNGELVALDAATGRPSPLGRVPVEVLRGRSEAVLLTDAESTYLIVNTGRGPSFFASDMPAVPASGQIFAFERDSGELRWRRDVSNRRLLCQDFDHMPVLLLTDSERTQKGGQGLWQVDLLALDKRTGEPVLDEPYYTTSTPFFRGLSVEPERRSIELTAYHTRLRLQAVPAPAAEPRTDADNPGSTP